MLILPSKLQVVEDHAAYHPPVCPINARVFLLAFLYESARRENMENESHVSVRIVLFFLVINGAWHISPL